MLEFIFFYLLFATLVGVYADKKQLGGFKYLTLSIILSPLFVGLWVLMTDPGGMKKCGKCAELVKQEAKICKHCRSTL